MGKIRQSKGPFGRGQDRICAVAAASTSREMIRQIGLGLRETRTVELRLDWLQSDAERNRVLSWVKRRRGTRATFVATCRSVAGGGKFQGDVQTELFWLIRAREAGCQWCDVEIETIRRLPDNSVREYAVPAKILLSEHDFERTPRFPQRVNLASRSEANAVKIAVRSRTIADSVRLLRLARRSRNLVAVPMGEVGLPARILALREGSALAYAPVGTATAPGQVSLHDFKHLYRAHELTGRTAVYGVIGDPIGHSLSPVLHNTGYRDRGTDAIFLPFLVRDLRDFLKAIGELGIRGFSVTLPHKQTILKYLSACEPLAAKMGAVNTVTVGRDGALYGCNTDHLGVLGALETQMRVAGSRILILGAGGSARSAAFVLAREGADVFICARRDTAAKSLAREASGEVMARRALRGERFDAILNATPVGMLPNVSDSPLAAGELNCEIAMDFVYRPVRTKFLQIAARKRIVTLSGVEMFLRQGIAQWEMWIKRKAPEKPMRRAVLAALKADGRLH